jgi:hypothetical protein
MNLAGIGRADIQVWSSIADAVDPAASLIDDGITLRFFGQVNVYGILPYPIADR